MQNAKLKALQEEDEKSKEPVPDSQPLHELPSSLQNDTSVPGSQPPVSQGTDLKEPTEGKDIQEKTLPAGLENIPEVYEISDDDQEKAAQSESQGLSQLNEEVMHTQENTYYTVTEEAQDDFEQSVRPPTLQSVSEDRPRPKNRFSENPKMRRQAHHPTEASNNDRDIANERGFPEQSQENPGKQGATSAQVVKNRKEVLSGKGKSTLVGGEKDNEQRGATSDPELEHEGSEDAQENPGEEQEHEFEQGLEMEPGDDINGLVSQEDIEPPLLGDNEQPPEAAAEHDRVATLSREPEGPNGSQYYSPELKKTYFYLSPKGLKATSYTAKEDITILVATSSKRFAGALKNIFFSVLSNYVSI